MEIDHARESVLERHGAQMVSERYSSIEKLTAFFLLLLLIVAVFPLEQPGMLEIWYGTEPSAIFQLKFMRLTSLEALLGVSLTLAYLSYSSSGRVRYRNHFGLILKLFIACIVWGYIGTMIGDAELGLDKLGTGYWKKLVYGMLVFVILTLFLDSRNKINQALLAIALACVVLDIYGLGRYILFGGLKTEKYIGNVVFWETIKLSLNVFVTILAAGMLFFSDRELSRSHKMIYRVALVLALLVIFVSSRRTSMIMVMVAGAMYLWLLFQRGRVGKALMIVGAGGLMVLILVIVNFEAFETKFLSRIESIQGVFSEEVEVDAGSTQGHMQELEVGWLTIKEHPIWGVGFAWEESSVPGGQRFWVHNSMLTFWMRFGILGIITYLYVYFKIFTVLWKAANNKGSITPFVFLIWFFVEFLSGLFFPPFFGYFKNSALFFGTLAIANAYLNTKSTMSVPKSTEAPGVTVRADRILRRKVGGDLVR